MTERASSTPTQDIALKSCSVVEVGASRQDASTRGARPSDVLLGRQQGHFHWPGNVWFRNFCRHIQYTFKGVNLTRKKRLGRAMYDRCQRQGVRFLEADHNGDFIDASPSRVVNKIMNELQKINRGEERMQTKVEDAPVPSSNGFSHHSSFSAVIPRNLSPQFNPPLTPLTPWLASPECSTLSPTTERTPLLPLRGLVYSEAQANLASLIPQQNMIVYVRQQNIAPRGSIVSSFLNDSIHYSFLHTVPCLSGNRSPPSSPPVNLEQTVQKLVSPKSYSVGSKQAARTSTPTLSSPSPVVIPESPRDAAVRGLLALTTPQK